MSSVVKNAPMRAAAKALGAIVALCACSAPTDAENVAVSADLLVTDDVVTESITVTADKLELPLAGNEKWLDKKPGSVVVGKPSRNAGPRNPHGFLRKVVSVSRDGSHIVVLTTPASIEDAVIEGEANTTATLDDLSEQPGGAVRTQGFGLGGTFDFSNRTLFSVEKQLDQEVGAALKGLSVKIEVKARQAHFGFHPTVDFGVKVHGAKIEDARLIARGDLNASIKLDAKVVLNGAVSQEAAKLLSKAWIGHTVKLAETRHTAVQFIGFLPVVENIRYQLNATCRVKFDAFVNNEFDAKLEMSAKSRVRIGAEYSKGIFKPVADANFSGDGLFSVERGASASIECGIGPAIEVLIYDIAGPKLSVLPFLDLTASSLGDGNFSWTAQPGVNVWAGLDIPLSGDKHHLGAGMNIFRWVGKPFAGGILGAAGTAGSSSCAQLPGGQCP